MSSPTLSAPLEQAAAEKAPGLPRLLMADDHHLILDALGAIMKREFEVLAVDTSQAFIAAVDRLTPISQCWMSVCPASMDLPLREPCWNAGQTFRSFSFPCMPNRRMPSRLRGLVPGAYLSKRVPAQELLAALHSVLGGGSLLPEKLPGTGTTDPDTQRTGLTARQREVLKLIATGCSAKDIATQLNISVRTAEFHRAAIMQRLGLHSTAQMTRYAIANNLG